MSILKGILHHWNKTTKSYDTIHPETEVAQITDWNNGIVNTLASTALGTLVSTLTSDSLLALLIKKVFDATGVKYNIAQNGYVCFGSLVGGLIIQWGTFQDIAQGSVINFPITFNNNVFAIAGNDQSENGDNAQVLTFREKNITYFKIYSTRINLSSANAWGCWIAVGI